jgi:prophage maintenance system killer protein/transcriptional regulator with XRE-family HTH domain
MNKSLNVPKLEDALIRVGMNQAALAARLSVSREAVSNWMRGESFPLPDKLIRIGKLVGLTFDELVVPGEGVGAKPILEHGARRKRAKPIVRSKRSGMRVAETPAAYGTQGGGIVLYRAPDGTVTLDVRLEDETIWLDAHQMALLFSRDRSVIHRHIRNIYDTNELDQRSTCAKKAQVAADGKVREMDLFNLDVVIGVGYRVSSKRGTQFRIWATRVLREHILKGFTVNERRLKELNQAVRLIADVAERRPLTGDEATGLLRVVGDYSRALDLLDDYDHQRVAIADTTRGDVVPVTYDEALRAVDRLRLKFGGSALFGREKDASLQSALGAVMQAFGGKDVYPSLEEKAAHLLYFVVKNHSFVDGNKRIAAALFLWFLEKNCGLYRPDGGKRIADNALVAMTLLIAESRPAEKDILTRVVVNLINRRNL